jgi:hypothetical protein
MKVKIERIPYASLRVEEFPSVYGQTLQICRRHNPDGLHLGKSWQEPTSFAYEEPDYTPLVNELNQLNGYYIQQLKARIPAVKTGRKPPTNRPSRRWKADAGTSRCRNRFDGDAGIFG